MWKQPAAAETTESDERKSGGAFFVGGDNFLPEPVRDGFDQAGALLDSNSTIAGGGELLVNASGLFRVEIPQFAAQRGCRHTGSHSTLTACRAKGG
jgi:hypothetical protein